MPEVISQGTQARDTVLVMNNASKVELHLPTICKFGNECQQSIQLLPSDEPVPGALRIVDKIIGDQLFEVDTLGASLSADYLTAAVTLLRVSRREYFTGIGLLAGLGVLALRKSEYLQPEDLFPAEHATCLMSPASSKRDMLSRIDNLHFCPSCAEFYCALGLEQEVMACQQLIRAIHERRSTRSVFRWSMIGMQRPPVKRL